MYPILFLIATPFLIAIIALIKNGKRKPSRTLLFHSIYENKRIPHSLSEISSAKFSSICKMIQEIDFKTVHFSRLSADTPNTLSIIFDDGLKSNMIAAEILEEYNLSATFFICSGTLTGDSITDVYSKKSYLSHQDIKSLSARGFEIGSHSISHLDLTLLSEKDLRKELLESKNELEMVIEKTITTFSFPYGIWNDDIIKIAKEIGYNKFAVYNFGSRANEIDIFHSTGVYPFETIEDIENMIKGKTSFGTLRGSIIPHFAKGSPLAAFSPLYSKIPTPWFVNSKKKK